MSCKLVEDRERPIKGKLHNFVIIRVSLILAASFLTLCDHLDNPDVVPVLGFFSVAASSAYFSPSTAK